MDLLIRWRVEHNTLLRIVCVTGEVVGPSKSPIEAKVLLMNSVQIIECAEQIGGKLMPQNTPPEENGTSVCFEVIFESNQKCIPFIQSIKGGSS